MGGGATYDKRSIDSILVFARGLTGHTLSDFAQIPPEILDGTNKGKLGELVESLYFKISPPNDKLPDFPEAGLELKTTGLRKNGARYSAKERLVLTKINPLTIRDESWSDSTFLAKCKNMLILFYLYEKETPVHLRRFELEPMLLEILKLPTSDLNQIERDWNYIREQCAQNKYHELSEGHTTYLKACRKGSGGESEKLRRQDEGQPGAKERAFSFPAGFMSSLVRAHATKGDSMLVTEGQTVEDAARQRLSGYLGKSFDEIAATIGFTNGSKSRNHALIKTLLTGKNREPIEIKKADIKLRTITVDSRGVPTENFPFDTFNPLAIGEELWETSAAINDLQSRFLFAVFEKSPDGLMFKNAGFWTMSNADVDKCMPVWETTKKRLIERNYTLPKSGDHPIMFVNTHGRDSSELIEAFGGDMITKRSFWLNKHYFVESVLPNLSW